MWYADVGTGTTASPATAPANLCAAATCASATTAAGLCPAIATGLRTTSTGIRGSGGRSERSASPVKLENLEHDGWVYRYLPVDASSVDQSHPTHYLALRRLPEGEQGELRPCDADHDDNRFGLVVADVLRRTDAVR